MTFLKLFHPCCWVGINEYLSSRTFRPTVRGVAGGTGGQGRLWNWRRQSPSPPQSRLTPSQTIRTIRMLRWTKQSKEMLWAGSLGNIAGQPSNLLFVIICYYCYYLTVDWVGLNKCFVSTWSWPWSCVTVWEWGQLEVHLQPPAQPPGLYSPDTQQSVTIHRSQPPPAPPAPPPIISVTPTASGLLTPRFSPDGSGWNVPVESWALSEQRTEDGDRLVNIQWPGHW